MPFLGIGGGKGQKEVIVRGERTDPRAILAQAAALVVITLLMFAVVRTYVHFWDWITRNRLHGWLAPAALILVVVGGFTDIILAQEIADPNWPNPRDSTSSTRPLWPWSREREKPPSPTTNVNIKVGFAEALAQLLDSLEVTEEDDDDFLE